MRPLWGEIQRLRPRQVQPLAGGGWDSWQPREWGPEFLGILQTLEFGVGLSCFCIWLLCGTELGLLGTSRKAEQPAARVKPRPPWRRRGEASAQPLRTWVWAPGCGPGHRLAGQSLPAHASPGPSLPRPARTFRGRNGGLSVPEPHRWEPQKTWDPETLPPRVPITAQIGDPSVAGTWASSFCVPGLSFPICPTGTR